MKGSRTRAQWVFGRLGYFRRFRIRTVRRAGSKKDFLRYKETARLLVHQRIQHFNQIYQFKFNRIAIRNQRTRWGSCSKKGNLNFNYKIVLLPLHLADYIIVHEVCHLGEFNHSQKFWDLVARTIPDHKERRKELKKSDLTAQ